MLSEEGKKVKKELENFNQTKRWISNLQEELTSLEKLEGALKSSSYEECVAGGKRQTYAEKRLIRIEELIETIRNALKDAGEKEYNLLKDLEHLGEQDPASKNLLWERYINCKSLARIKKEFNYSERNIYYLFDKAINKMCAYKRLQ